MPNILVICTGNSCRSVRAEALLNHLGQERLNAFSAGSHPVGKINEAALATLKRHSLPTEGYKSQSWEDFQEIPMDIVITVCDNAAGETCPVYLTQAVRAHWGVSEPGHIEGTDEENTDEEKIATFEQTFAILKRRVEKMLALDLEQMPKQELTDKLNEIGKLN